MTEPIHDPNEQPDTGDSLSSEMPAAPEGVPVPPPVPQKKPGFLRRLFTTRKQQQAVAVQNGYLEMVDLIRAIRSHLDRQESVQIRVLSMLDKVPDAMDRQHEVMTLFKQQLENNIVNDQRLTDSMGRLSGTLDSMNESQKASSRTVTDLITRSRESEQLLREVMRRAERRMTLLIAFFVLLVIGTGVYLVHWQNRGTRAMAPDAESPAPAAPAPEIVAIPEAPPPADIDAIEPAAPEEPVVEPAAADAPPAPVEPEPEPVAEDIAPPPAEEPAPEATVAPATDAQDKPKARERRRRKPETKPDPQPEPAADVEPDAEPVPETEPQPNSSADSEPESAAVEDDPDLDPGLRLFQLEAAIGDAVVDAFAPRGEPVSLP